MTMPVPSILPDVHIPDNVDLWSFLKIKAAKFMDRDLLVDGSTGQTLTFSQFFNEVEKVRCGLHKIGMRKGDILLIFAHNNIEQAVLLMAVTALGGVMTTCNNQYTKDELLEVVQMSKPVYVAVSSDLLSRIQEVQTEYGQFREIITFGESTGNSISFSQLSSMNSNDVPVPSFTPREDVAWIYYSSGTTGKPKGVMLTHYCLTANLLQSENPAISFDIDEDPGAYAIFFPFYHMYASLMLLVALTIGKTMIVMRKFSFTEYLDLVQRYKVRVMVLVPPVATLLAKHPKVEEYDLSCVKVIICAAAPCGKDVEEAIRARLPATKMIKQGYGMTETAPVISLMPNKTPKQGSVGVVVPNTELKIVDEKTKLEVENKKDGEIWVRGPQLMKGYLNNPQATADTIDSEGWLHTGDMGYVDEDGYLFITGRIKELIKYKALQVAPASLEDVLLTHEAVADAAVIGIPDTYAGELPKAFVVLKQGFDVTPKDIQNYVAGRVADFKKLRGGVEFRTEIPKSASGKILRRVLIEEEKKRASKL